MADQINVTTVVNISVKDSEHLNNIILNILKVDGVYSVKRKGEVEL